MRISLKASLLFILGLSHPVIMSYSTPPEDSDGSGYDRDTDDSQSVDWPEDDEMINTTDLSNSTDVRIHATNAGGGAKISSHGPSVLTFDDKHWPSKDSEPVFVVANTKSFLERKEVFAGVIAGGVIGVTLAAALAGILIYKWQKKDDRGYIQGQQSASDEEYHNANREEVVF